jgi:predicted ATPase/class 3 adenylate cyclase
MKCGSCGFANREGRSVCERCAAPLHIGCTRCGFRNSLDAKYCGGCATPLGQESGPVGSLRERNGNSIRDALVSERKLLTVMFADTKGSLELMEGRDAEQSQALLDSVIKAMIEAVHRYGGTVNRVAGDGIMALFGAPVAQEDHAVRACYAALAMQDLMAHGNSERVRQFGVEPQIRIGLHSGEVVVQPIDNDVALEYRVIGTTAHVASRMEQMARPGSILLSETTARLAKGYVRVEQLEAAPVKGLREPIPIFELKAAEPVQSRFQVSLARGLARLTGRGAELSAMSQALACAAAGAGQVVALSGDPGIGKSRLCHELAASAPPEEWLKLNTGAVSHGQTTPYLPWTGLLKSYFGIADSDPPEAVRSKVASALRSVDPELAGSEAALVPFLDVRHETPEWRALEPPQRRKLVFAGLRQLLLALARVQPVLLVVEDLHWLDSASRAFLDDLAGMVAKSRLALFLTFRPEFQHAWHARANFTEIQLAPLTAAEAMELLDHMLGPDDSVRAVQHLVIERAQGNPFFIEEIVRSLVETGVLTGRPTDYRLGTREAKFDMPATLEAVIASRVDRLPRSAKELLQAASAVGRTVGIDLLRHIAQVDQETMQRDLRVLRASGMLQDVRLFPSPKVGFAHALTQETVYRTLLRSRRVELHARVVGALEESLGDSAVEHVERLADQSFRGEIWDRTVPYHVQAGSRALARSAWHEAAALAERGLTAATHLEDYPSRARAEIDLRLILFTVLYTLGDQDRLMKTISEAETLAETLGDTKRRAFVANLLTATLWASGDHERGLSVARRALTLSQGQGDPPSQLVAAFQLGFVYHALGEFRRSIDVYLELLPRLGGTYERRRLAAVVYPSVGARAFLASSMTHVGDFAEAALHIEAGRQIADALNHPYSQVLIRFVQGNLLLRRGEAPTASRIFGEALRLCRENEVMTMYPAILAYLGLSRAAEGDVAGAIALLEEALHEKAYRFGGMYTKFYLLHNLGRVYLAGNRHEEAWAQASRAEETARETGEHAHRAYALTLLGDIAATSRGVSTTAEEYYRAAMAIAERSDMKPLLADCHFQLAALYAERNDRRAVEEHGLANALYRSIGLAPPDKAGIGSIRQVAANDWKQNDG